MAVTKKLDVAQEGALNGIPLSGEAHHFISHPGSKKLVILMSATGTKPGRFNLWKHADDLPYHKLYLRVPTNDWYQNGVPTLGGNLEETYDSIRKLAEGCDADEIYTVGSSMGGYGAILFGIALDAAVLAFSPETRLNLPFSRSYKMIPSDVDIVKPNLLEDMKAAKRPIHIYTGELDPVDLYCAQMVHRLPLVNVETFPYDEHTVMRSLFFSERLVPTIRAFVEDRLQPVNNRSKSVFKSSKMASRFFSGWVKFHKKDYPAAAKHLKEALEVSPFLIGANVFMAKTLLRLGDSGKALEHATLAFSMLPEDYEHRFLVAHCLRMAGALDEAKQAHKATLEIWPDSPRTCFDLGQIYLTCGEFEAARRYFGRAVDLEPATAAYTRGLERARAKIEGADSVSS